MAEAMQVPATVTNSENVELSKNGECAGGRALSEPDDEGRDRRLDGGEDKEDEDLRQQVGLVDRPTACSEDRMFADQVANGQRGTHEDGADIEQDHDAPRLVVRGRAGRRDLIPVLPFTVSDSAPIRNGNIARNTE